MANEQTMRRLLRERATALVRDDAEVECVLLFGSRARGSHCADSDFDVALVVAEDGDADEKTQAFRGAGEWPGRLEVWALSRRRIESHGHLVGNYARGVLEDGVPLAGDWNPPRQGERHMANKPDSDVLENLLEHSTGSLQSALANRRRVAQDIRAKSSHAIYQTDLQNAAELWGKAVLVLFGVTPADNHNMANAASRLWQAHDGNVAARRWSTLIAELNGKAHNRRQAIYERGRLEHIDTVDRRLRSFADYLGEWLAGGILVERAPKGEERKHRRMLEATCRNTRDVIAEESVIAPGSAFPQPIIESLRALDCRCAATLAGAAAP